MKLIQNPRIKMMQKEKNYFRNINKTKKKMKIMILTEI